MPTKDTFYSVVQTMTVHAVSLEELHISATTRGVAAAMQHLQAAAAMASQRQLHQSPGPARMQLRWHPHRMYTNRVEATAMASPPQAAAVMASPRQLQQSSGPARLQLRWHPHGNCRKALAQLHEENKFLRVPQQWMMHPALRAMWRNHPNHRGMQKK